MTFESLTHHGEAVVALDVVRGVAHAQERSAEERELLPSQESFERREVGRLVGTLLRGAVVQEPPTTEPLRHSLGDTSRHVCDFFARRRRARMESGDMMRIGWATPTAKGASGRTRTSALGEGLSFIPMRRRRPSGPLQQDCTGKASVPSVAVQLKGAERGRTAQRPAVGARWIVPRTLPFTEVLQYTHPGSTAMALGRYWPLAIVRATPPQPDFAHAATAPSR